MKKSLFSAYVVGLGLTVNLWGQVPNYLPTNGLVGYWPFNGNANDESGNGNNGTVNGATLTADRNSNINNAYNFNGSSDILVNDNNDLSFNNGEISLSVWIYMPFVSFNNRLISKDKNDHSNRDFLLKTTSNGLVQFTTFSSGDNGVTLLSNQILTSENWIHIVVTKDQLKTKLYLNGLLDNTIDTNTSIAHTSANLFFGKTSEFWSEYFAGDIDDIGIWNRALSGCEIADLYHGLYQSVLTTQPANQTVNSTNSAQFIVNANSGSSFQWQTDLGVGFQNLSNAGQYSGVNNDTLTLANATIANNNQQFRCIVNSGSCTATSDIAILTISTSGIDELSNNESINLYPNPASLIFEIQTKLLFDKIEIRDMQGRIVKTEHKVNKINIESIQKGTYVVQLIDDKSKVIGIKILVKE